MKNRVANWKTLALRAGVIIAFCLSLGQLAAQSGLPILYLNKPFTIPAGRYESDLPFRVYGGDVFIGGGGNIAATQPINVFMAGGSDYHKVNLMVINAHLHAKNVLFKNCTIDVGSAGRVYFEDCIFDGVTFTLGTGHAPGTPPEAIERYKSLTTLKNSFLYQVQFQMRGGDNVVLPLKMEQCTMQGPGLLPMVLTRAGVLEDMKRYLTEVRGCSFIQCSYSSPFLAVTKDSMFDSCTLVPGLPIPDITSPLELTATFHPAETSAQIAAQLPQYVITPLGPEVSPGCKLAYSLNGGTLSRGVPGPEMPARMIASVIPAAEAIPRPTPGSTPTMTRVPLSPAPVYPPINMAPTPSLVEAKVSPTPGAPDTGLKLQQTNVHGLLIMSLAGGDAGSASKMAAIAMKGYSTDEPTVKFNQPVGSMMAKALGEVAKFTQVNHGGWPKGYQIELSFADKYSNKDGPSAAVACALLLHSMISGQELDQAFAVTGDMNADGSVQPIGGVAAKIRGATKGHCKLIGIPAKNEPSLGDLLLTDGPAPFAAIQIFSLQHFRDAEALAVATKPELTAATIAEMNRVQEVLMRNPAQMGSWLRNQHVVAKLQQVLKDSPNNLSAKYLLMYASGKAPQTLTLAGSLSAIEDAGGTLIASIKSNKGETFGNIGQGSVGSSLTRLQALRARCDGRTRTYADAIIRFGAAVKEALDRPAQTATRVNEYRSKIRGAADAADAELSRLLNDPAIQEELEG